MVGILIVSHSEDAARGIAEIASGMSGAGGDVPIVWAGGGDDGGLGVSVPRRLEALTEMLPTCEGVLILPDLGSSILSSRGAIEMLSPKDASKVMIADAPILEGAMMAAVEASAESDLESVAQSAAEARNLKKVDH
ncbi:MAG: PTS mannose transporter subunit IID [Synergistaceae bacterium]|jgi:dihydroxyacetone kinase phosphotransfer subunit|nr:PTS mannose transporter subunit IID [Synergistaceae bacterium]